MLTVCLSGGVLTGLERLNIIIITTQCRGLNPMDSGLTEEGTGCR